MTRLTTLQKNNLTKMCVNAQRGTLGTRIDALEYGALVTPSAGTVTPMRFIKYTTTPAVGTATATHAAVTLVVTDRTVVTTGITNPDFPRTLTIKGNDGNVSGTVTITGTDILGNAIEDTITASGTNEVEGVFAFKTVTIINLPPYSVAGTETISIGRGNSIGLPILTPNASTVIASSFNGSADAGTVTPDATDVAPCLYVPAGTLNGVKLLELVLVV